MNTRDTAYIFLVDDHPIVRLGYRMLLRADTHLNILGEAEKGVDAVHQIISAKPDLAIIDISLPDISGLEVTRQLQRACPEVEILIVSGHRSRTSAERAFTAGAKGYIIKDKAESLIREAIDALLDGGTFICSEMKEKLGDDMDRLIRS